MKIYKKHSSPQRGFSPRYFLQLGVKPLQSFFWLLTTSYQLLATILTLPFKLLPARLMRKLSSTQRMFVNMIIATTILIFGVFIYTSMINPEQTKAAWFDENYLYRQVANITNSNSTALTDFQVALTVDTATLISAGKMRSDCNDIRITDVSGNVLPQYISTNKNNCNSSTTAIWTKVPSIPTSGATLYIYYGNSTAANIEKGSKVFEFFDDFESYADGVSINGLNGWTIKKTGGSGWAKIVTYNSKKHLELYSTSGFTAVNHAAASSNSGYAMETVFQSVAASNDYMTGFDDGTDANGFDNNGFYNYMGGSSNTISVLNSTAGGSRTGLQSVSDSLSNSTYYNSSFRWNGTSLKVFRNGSQILTGASSTYSTRSYLYLSVYTNAKHAVDWVGLRKDAVALPTASFATEEQSPAPVAYWKFDEGNGTVASSSGSRKLNADIYRATWQAESQCLSKKCLLFNGTDSFLQIAHNASLNAGTGSMSWGSWFRTGSSGRSLIYRKSDASNTLGILFDIGNSTAGQARCLIHTSTTATSGTITYHDNKWHYMTCVLNRSNNTLNLYIDGRQVTSTDASAISATDLNSTAVATIGQGGASTYFNGSIDEFRIYPYARSAAQIQSDFTSRGSVKGVSSSLGGSSLGEGLSNGLVGYWKMDEALWNGTSGEVIDSSGNSNNGTAVSGAEASPSAKFGNSGYFAGIDEYTSTTTNISCSLNQTTSAWFKGSTTGGSRTIFELGGCGGRFLAYYLNAGTISFYPSSATNNITTTATYTEDTWHHLVVSTEQVSGTQQVIARIYVDGVLAKESTIVATSPGSAGKFYVGSVVPGTANRFKGNIDDVRLYNRTLNPMEVQQLYSFAPGPIGYWNFEEGQGNSVNDNSGNGNNGSWTGTAPYWAQGKYGKGGSFNGSDDYVSITDSTNSVFDVTNEIAIEAWVRFKAIPTKAYEGILSKDNAYLLLMNSAGNGFVSYLYNGSTWIQGQDTGNLNLQPNTWYHIAMTYTSGVYKIYKNGVVVSTDTDALTISTNNNPIRIGSDRLLANRIFNGQIDEVRVYNYARTSGQIVSDMNAGHPLGGSPVGSQLGYWKMDEGYGSTSYDSGPNKYDGTLSNTAWRLDNCKFNKCLYFNGASSYVNPSAFRLNSQPQQTYTFWANPQANGSTNPTFLSDGAQSGTSGYIWIYKSTSTGTDLFFQYANGTAATTLTFTGAMPMNEWHYYAFVADYGDGDNVKLYRDGKLVSTQSMTTPLAPDSTNFFMGRYNASHATSMYNGFLDEVKIYTAGLTAEEIKIDYNRGSSLSLGAVGTASDGITATNSASAAYCVPGDTSTCSAPVAEWKFEEHQGGTANDTSGNGNNGTLHTTTWSPGKVGSGLKFNGTSSYVNSTSSIDLTGTNVITLEFWKYQYSWTNDGKGIIESTTNFNSFTTGVVFSLNDSGDGTGCGAALIVSLKGNTGYNIKCYNRPSLSQWHHYVAIYNKGASSANEITLYVDGILQTHTQQAYNNENSNNFGNDTWYFMARAGSSFFGEGILDQIQIYNYARTAAQVAYDYNRGKPVAQWKMDECQGSTLNESMGSTMSGTLTVGASGTQTSAGTCSTSGTAWYNGVAGKFNYSLNFDGTDDFATILDNSALQMTSNITVSLWVKPTTLNGQLVNYPISKGSGGTSTQGWAFGINGTYTGGCTAVGQIFVYTNNTFICSPTNRVITTGSWQHMVFTNDGTNTKLYINGQLVNSGAQTLVTSANLQVNIGRRTDASWYFKGGVDDTQIFNYALTATQVKTLMNQGGAVRFGPNTGAP